MDKDTLGLQYPPISETRLREGGAIRDITRSVGPDPAWQGSPARTLEGLLNPELISPLPKPVERTRDGILGGARELNMKASIDQGGNYHFSQNGLKMQFDNPEDAAKFIDGIKFMREERAKLTEEIGGPECA